MEKKFRAWDKENKHYLDPNMVAIAPSDSKFPEWCCSGEGVTIRIDSERFIIEQWTGIYDSTTWEELSLDQKTEFAIVKFPSDWKGFELYENDTIEVSGEEPLSTSSTITDYDWTIRGVIVFYDFSWCLKESDGHIWFLTELFENDDFEINVLGNLNQHPELFKKGK